MSNFERPMQLSKALHKQLCLPELSQQATLLAQIVSTSNFAKPMFVVQMLMK
jgi:hypothetical protein